MRFSSTRLYVAIGGCLMLASRGVPSRAEEWRSDYAAQSSLTVQSPGEISPSSANQQPPATSPVTQQPAPSQAPRQQSVFPRLGARPPVVTQPFVEPQVTNQTRQALGFYGGYSARATLSQLPRRASIQSSSPPPSRRQAKPFETIHREPTVSPYLNLYRDEENVESAPNYYAFVRPQLEQLDANRLQQREIQQLRGQLQGMSSTVAGPRYQSGGMPATGTAARYMDTAQFYGGWQR
jgi:hypothetical protein